MTNTAVILLGTNSGNLLLNLESARKLIAERAGEIVHYSGIYETEPWGKADQPFFLNQVIVVHTKSDPGKLLKTLLGIEEEMGRKRIAKWESRSIDLDILFFNNEVISREGLTIPHPRLHERKFTLIPLAAILPDLVHPVLHRKIQELLDRVDDSLNVRLIVPEFHLPKK